MDTQQTDYRPLTDDAPITDSPLLPARSKFGRKRKPADRRNDQAFAAALAATGLVSPKAIAEAVNGRAGDRYQITISQVKQDIATGLAKYADIAPDDLKDARLLQAARLDMLRTLALDAYIDSQVQVTETVTVVTDETGKETGAERRTRSTKKSAPDAKYLALIVQIEVERNKILGIYAPERKEERQDLTVTFTWKESERLPEPQTVDYRLLEDSDGVG